MLKKLAWIALGGVVLLLVAVAALAAVIAFQPAEFAVERSTAIAAPPEMVFAHVNDLARWDDWSPWKDLDPEAETRISDPSAGLGATFYWSGNDQVGEGTLTVVDSQPGERLEIEQEFVRPMPGKARVLFLLSPEGEGTRLTWRMDGESDFAGKAISLFCDLDALLGPDFEKGLANLRRVAEASSP